MSDRKVSELTSASAVSAADLLYYIQGGASKNVTVGTLFKNAPETVFTGNVAFASESTTAAGGVIPATSSVTKLTTDGSNYSCTIAAGKQDQLKIVVLTATSGGAVTVGGLAGNANVQLSKVGHAATFLYTGNLWYVLGGSATVTVP